MVCKLPMTEVGEFRLHELRLVEWSQLSELQLQPVVSGAETEASRTERSLPMLMVWHGGERASQAAAQLSPRERRLLCSLASQPGPDPLGSALTTVFTQRLRSSLHLPVAGPGKTLRAA